MTISNHCTGKNALLLSLNHYEEFGPEREAFATQAALAELNYCHASAMRSLRGGVVGEDLRLGEAVEMFGMAVQGFIKYVVLGGGYGICCTLSSKANSKLPSPHVSLRILSFTFELFFDLRPSLPTR